MNSINWKFGIKGNLKSSLNFISTLPKRIPELEEFILNEGNDNKITSYAENVIKGRWLEAEHIILKENDDWNIIEYAKNVIKGRWYEAEHILLKCNDVWYKINYAINILRCRWTEAEPSILKSTIENIIGYAENVMSGRWYEADSIIFESSYAEYYVKHIFNKYDLEQLSEDDPFFDKIMAFLS